MNQLKTTMVVLALACALSAVAATTAWASVLAPEGPRYAVGGELEVVGCKQVAVGNFKSLDDCEKGQNVTKLGYKNGWIQECEEIAGGKFATEEDCLDFQNPVNGLKKGWAYLHRLAPFVVGETRLLLASAKEHFILANSLGLTITCTGLTLPQTAHMQIMGSTGQNGGTSNEVIEFTGCTQEGNGTPCEITSSTITTTLILNVLGYASSSRGDPVLVLYQPQAGSVLSTVKFTGTGCKVTSSALTGNAIGQEQVGGAPVEFNQLLNQGETLHGEVAFGSSKRTIWTEASGTLKEVKGKLEFGGTAAKLTGVFLLLVDEGGKAVPWGVFT
jgi:hypothetical protein